MTNHKTSRALGAAFLLQFITSFFLSGVFLKPLWLVPGNIGATLLKIADNPAILQANIFVDILTALGVIFLGAMLFLTLRRQNEKNGAGRSGVLYLGYDLPFVLFVPYVPFEFVTGIWILIKGVPNNQS